MRDREMFQMTCACGKNHRVSEDRVEFHCSCGRKSLVDWACTLTRNEMDRSERHGPAVDMDPGSAA